LAVAGYRWVERLDPNGRLRERLGPLPGKVPCLAYSPDGRWLAAGSGETSRSGEIRLWDLRAHTSRTLSGGHSDLVYGIAWSPDSRRLAAGSYDKLVTVWDVATGKPRRLKDHTDAVYAVAFSPDGSRLASVSGDRTVKIWDPVAGRRLYTLGDATAELYSVAFAPSGKELAAGGADRMLRVWSIGPASGSLARTAFAHQGAVIRLLYTHHGSGIYTSSEDRTIKLWDAGKLEERQVLPPQPDWAMGLALRPDDRRLAVCRYDGSLAFYDAPAAGKDRVSTAPEARP
jgi:dipeptidyl aminopeptidase/acylaminoacyl peptidase